MSKLHRNLSNIRKQDLSVSLLLKMLIALVWSGGTLFPGLAAQTELVLDPSLDLEVLSRTEAHVADVVQMPDGGFLVGGRFIRVDGETRFNLARLDASGRLDTSFPVISTDGTVFSFAVAEDGGVFIGGRFKEVNGTPRAGLARLAPDGSLDEAFAPDMSALEGPNDDLKVLAYPGGGVVVLANYRDLEGKRHLDLRRLTSTGELADGHPSVDLGEIRLKDAALASDGKVYVAGARYGETKDLVKSLARFETTGELDLTFDLERPELIPNVLLVEPDGSIIIGGGHSADAGGAIVRLHTDGKVDSAFNGRTPYDYSFVYGLARAAGGGYLVRVNGLTAEPIPPLGRFTSEGEWDATFRPSVHPFEVAISLLTLTDGDFLVYGGHRSGEDPMTAHITRMSPSGVIRPDFWVDLLEQGRVISISAGYEGGILVGGEFSQIGTTPRTNLALVNDHGEVDTAYPQTNDTVTKIRPTSDGGHIVLGSFDPTGGSVAPGALRISSDGAIDKSLLSEADFERGGFSCAAAMPDGSIVLGGRFRFYYDSLSHNTMIRVLADGTLDLEFKLDPANYFQGPDGQVDFLETDLSGRILLAGRFDHIQNTERLGFARALADGTLDLSFNPEFRFNSARNLRMISLANGSMLVRGGVKTEEGRIVYNIYRFMPDGSLDTSFELDIDPDRSPTTMVLAPDGAIIVATSLAGPFSANGVQSRVERYLPDGSRDLSFTIELGRNGAVADLFFDSSGRLVTGGSFNMIEGQPRLGLARFSELKLFVRIVGIPTILVASGGSHILNADVHGNTGAPQFQWNLNDTPLEGEHSASLEVTDFASNKAGRYTVTVSADSGSVTSAPVELRLPVPPTITDQPANRNESIGGSVLLAVDGGGEPDPTYQWFKDGAPLEGEIGRELRLWRLTADDAGSYHVELSNLAGSVVSARAQITVTPLSLDPLFTPAVGSLDDVYSGNIFDDYTDGRMIVGGNLSVIGGYATDLVRLNVDGSVDPGFAPFDSGHSMGFGTILAVDSNGTLYTSRDENQQHTGYVWSYIRKVRSDGSLVSGWGVKVSRSSLRMKILPDGKLLIGGLFDYVNDISRPKIARLNPDGSLDETFLPTVEEGPYEFAVDQSGRILASGRYDGAYTVHRLLDDGQTDTVYAAPTFDNGLKQMIVLSDGSLFIRGEFRRMNNQEAPSGYARLLNDGSIAENFLPPEGLGTTLNARLLTNGSIRLVARGSGLSFDFLSIPGDGSAPEITNIPLGVHPAFSDIGVGIQPDGTVLLVGHLSSVNGERSNGLVRIKPDGSNDPDFSSFVGGSGRGQIIRPMPRGRIAIAGRLSSAAYAERDAVAIMHADGRVDESFLPETNQSDFVDGLVVLKDESLVLSGAIQSVDGLGPPTDKAIRLLPDGARDQDFERRFSGTRPALAVLPNGKLLIGGKDLDDLREGSQRVTLLNENLTLDTSFDITGTFSQAIGLPDGRILILGSITDTEGVSRDSLCRLRVDGSVDADFNVNPTSGGSITSFEVMADGRIIVGGGFKSIGGVLCPGLARLNADGSVDTGFVSGMKSGPGAFAVERDGKVVVYTTTSALGIPENYGSVIGRLNSDGSVDPSLEMGVYGRRNETVSDLTVRDNGDILGTGYFTSIDGATRISAFRITTNRFQAFTESSRVSIPVGGTGYLHVSTLGASRPSYRWLQDDRPVIEADRAILALRDFREEDAGLYRAEVIDGGSVVRSEAVEVVVSYETETEILSPLTFSESGGIGSIRVSAPAGSTWTVTGLPDWIEVHSEGTGDSRTVSFSLDPNLSGASRVATIQIAGQTFAVEQGTDSARLGNISTRARVGSGGQVLIVGFVTQGGQPLDILSRGVGPTLGTFGLKGILPDPVLRLFSGDVEIERNTDWESGANRELILAEGQRVGAFALAEGQGDAALLVAVTPGAYTAKLSDNSGGSGVALVEFYDRTLSDLASWRDRVVNISTRGQVGRNDEVLIAGLVVTGSVAKQVLVRGVGPGLEEFGVTGVLADPYLRVVRSGETVAQNNDWGYNKEADLVALATALSGGFPLELESRDAALVMTLEPGSYTVLLSGADDGTGVALIEVYDLE